MIDNEKLKNLLENLVEVHHLSSVDSTNDYGKKLIKEGAQKSFLVIADEQTNGRGRQGKSFYSPKDSGLYLSLALPVSNLSCDHLYITTASSVALFNAIRENAGITCKIKWVNDLYFNDKKVAGILTESVTTPAPFIIIGIGINLTTDFFPDDLRDIATSLGVGVEKEAFITTLVKNILTFWENPKDKSFLSLYKENSLVLGKDIYYFKNNVKHRGFAKDIKDDGALLVETEDGIEILNSGEITLRL